MATRVARTDSKRQASRSVSLLTPEQLQRKREQDRESQRQTRIRVKQTILELEARVDMLTQQLHASKMEIDGLRAYRRHLPSPPRSVSDVEQNSPPVMDISILQKQCPSPFDPLPQHLQSSFMAQRSQNNGTPDHLLTPILMPDYPYNGYMAPPMPVNVWEAKPYFLAANNAIDQKLLDALEASKAVQAMGGNVFEFQSPTFPSMSVLLNAEAYKNTLPVTSAIVSTLPMMAEVSNLPQQITAVYLIALMIRWQVTGTQEDYEAIPDWLRPGAAQIVTPHPFWVDHFPWPRARDRLCRDPKYADATDATRQLCFRGVSVNWPYDSKDTLLLLPGANEYVINPVFVSHIRKLENWTVSRDLMEAHPEFEADIALDKGRNA